MVNPTADELIQAFLDGEKQGYEGLFAEPPINLKLKAEYMLGFIKGEKTREREKGNK